MKFCVLFLGLCVLVLSSGSSVAASGSTTILNDAQRGFSLRYATENGFVVFTGILPASDDFFIYVDGDQDGKWGIGPDNPDREKELILAGKLKSDLSYARDKDANFALCAQYVWSAFADNPDQVYASSGCREHASKASVEVGQPNKAGVVFMRYRIPRSELFGTKPTAHLVFALYLSDTKETHYYFSPSAPFVLKK